jgi:hypothetical protein
MVRPVIAVDLHQHLWPEDVLRTLEGRSSAPRAVHRRGTWEVRLRHEPTFVVDPADHDPMVRAQRLTAVGIDRAVVALSSPVGVESVPGAVAAWSAAATTLPAGLGWWAAVPHDVPALEQAAVARDAIADGAAGLCLSAAVLRSLAHAEAALPLLRQVESHGVPVFVHPGEADGAADDPGWWSPTTSYVAQMHIAWHAFHVAVRPALPGLRVVFALLAGLAPLHLERTVGRGASLQGAVDDPRSFYDTSSYGPAAIRAMACAVSTGQLVHGTDHPVVRVDADPVAVALGADAAALVRRENTARALGHTWVPA